MLLHRDDEDRSRARVAAPPPGEFHIDAVEFALLEAPLLGGEQLPFPRSINVQIVLQAGRR